MTQRTQLYIQQALLAEQAGLVDTAREAVLAAIYVEERDGDDEEIVRVLDEYLARLPARAKVLDRRTNVG